MTGGEAMRGSAESGNGSSRAGVEPLPDAKFWEYALGREIVEARSACLQGLGRIPTGLGRLAYIAILQQRLLEDHEELFGEWRGCSLQQKYEWVYRLLATESRSSTPPEAWLSRATYADLVPPSVDEEARALYLTDIEAVLEILRKELPKRVEAHGSQNPQPVETPAGLRASKAL